MNKKELLRAVALDLADWQLSMNESSCHYTELCDYSWVRHIKN